MKIKHICQVEECEIVVELGRSMVVITWENVLKLEEKFKT